MYALFFETLKTKLLTENVGMNENLSSFQTQYKQSIFLYLREIWVKNNDFMNFEGNQPWYNEDCKFKRNYFYNCLNNYRFNKQDETCRENMVQTRSEYKKVLRQSRYAYRKLET